MTPEESDLKKSIIYEELCKKILLTLLMDNMDNNKISITRNFVDNSIYPKYYPRTLSVVYQINDIEYKTFINFKPHNNKIFNFFREKIRKVKLKTHFFDCYDRFKSKIDITPPNIEKLLLEESILKITNIIKGQDSELMYMIKKDYNNKEEWKI